MIEVVEEIKAEKERPTETDVRLLFCDLQKAMEALQRIFVSELDKLGDDNVDTAHAGIEIKRNQLIVRLGDYVMYHDVHDSILHLGD